MGYLMERNVFSGGDNTSLCASGIASSGEQGMFAFDLQLFNDSLKWVNKAADGTVTLNLSGKPTNAGIHDLIDQEGNFYGKVYFPYPQGTELYVTLESPPNNAPVTAVVNSMEDIDTYIYNSRYLGENVACEFKNRFSDDQWFYYKDKESTIDSQRIRVQPCDNTVTVTGVTYGHDA
ncbi:MAG: hypothetical protein IJT01_07780 [Selenomonadaceae bacterium]|nr:hypothetical protein [Selenomonadaceae bacterium]